MFKELLSDRKVRLPLVASALFLGLELASPWLPLPAWLAAALAGGAMLIARQVLMGGFQALIKLRFSSIQLLITLAAIGAMVLGQTLEAAMVLALFSLSEALEDLGFSRSYHALESLLARAPKQVRLKGGEEKAIEALVAGEVVELRPGDVVPVDGVVLAGQGLVDEAAISGEALPKDRGPGERVFAGTVNVDGFLEVQAERAGRDTTLSRIVALTYEAAERKLKLQTLVERFARVYTPTIIALALGLALLPWALGQAWQPWLAKALSLLVIACPCALTMATPVSVFAAVSRASRAGAVVKGGRAMEGLASVKVVCFDKTRTLTYGTPEVVEVLPLRGWSSAQVLAAAAGLEALSNHPLAVAVMKKAKEHGLTVHAIDGFKDVVGRGVSGRCGVCLDDHHCLGSPAFAVAEHGVGPEILERIGGLEAQGKTVIVLSDSQGPLGLLAVEDKVREGAGAVVTAIHSMGLRTLMLTGDQAQAAAKVASETGIQAFKASLLPQDKAAEVQKLQAELGPVVLIGDGVNDAPALATAAVGIALGAAGSDVAVENADIALMNDNLALLPFLFRLSRACVAKIRFNTALAVGTKLGVLSLALLGWAGLEAAILSDVGVTVLVIFNGLHLLSFEENFSHA